MIILSSVRESLINEFNKNEEIGTFLYGTIDKYGEEIITGYTKPYTSHSANTIDRNHNSFELIPPYFTYIGEAHSHLSNVAYPGKPSDVDEKQWNEIQDNFPLSKLYFCIITENNLYFYSSKPKFHRIYDTEL